ncbi:PLP-dependent aminotransferase family protein [Tahibacter amnicola]|uniref:PLP-dependent aminotransferase family protein n=1 Tax=Tahibacter amnicola TaxID=2976241 RepID=A0ABY6BEQ2_9GAMM|nr:PLP-dependent aminotransferase family protein [Tahibacter amnicola]UXI67738.1 PLP-dependent aminotransferase family protein [Tahibacter amnicola]
MANFMDPVLQLSLDLPPPHSRRLLHSLHTQLRCAILEGRLKTGVRLPSTRALAASLGISRNTAIAAYDRLLSEGYLRTRPAAGVFVCHVPARSPRSRKASTASGDRRLHATWRQLPPLDAPHYQPRPRLDFRLGEPDGSALPQAIWQRLSARALRQQMREGLVPLQPRGRPALRNAIAGHVSFTRAVACTADDVFVTSGAQQAFYLLARILVTPGRSVVAMEDPGYAPARAAFLAAGARIAPVPVDDEGLIVERLPRRVDAIYVTPSHQFPLGQAMSLARRTALIEYARRTGAVILEDDYDGEFRFGDRPLDALQTLDDGDSVFYIGTFSKSLFTSLRLGFIVAPAWAHQTLETAKRFMDAQCNVHVQETLAAFIREGHLARHVRRVRGVYQERRNALLEGLGRLGWLHAVPASAGLHLCARLDPTIDRERLLARAREKEVGLYAGDSYFIKRPVLPSLLFGYGVIDRAGVDEAMQRLRKIQPPRR